MLSFRNKLNSRDPEAIRKISASTGFFDATDIEISVNLAHSALDGQRHANDNVEEPSFLLPKTTAKPSVMPVSAKSRTAIPLTNCT